MPYPYLPRLSGKRVRQALPLQKNRGVRSSELPVNAIELVRERVYLAA